MNTVRNGDIMKDSIGQEIKIGDTVLVTCSHYQNLLKRVVIHITPKRIRVINPAYIGGNGRYSSKGDIIIPKSCVVINKLLESDKT